MNERVPTTTSAHARHDLDRVAVLAGRPADLDEREAAAARTQVAGCTACADLLADLVLLQATLPKSSTPARPRDFSLTPADAARLRTGGWRRLFGFVGSARDSFTRPLAVGLTSLGLVGLLVASVPSFIGGSGGAAMAPGGPAAATTDVAGAAEQAAGAAPAASAAALAPAASAAPPSGAPAALPSASRGTSVPAPGAFEPVPAPAASSAASAAPGTLNYDTARAAASQGTDSFAGDSGTVFSGGNPDELTTVSRDTSGGGLLSLRDDGSGLSVLFVVAGVMLIAGLGLFLLRWTSRRLF
jgi:hypothetical protein